MTLTTLLRAAAGAATAASLLLASTSALALVAPPPTAFSGLVVFGDSLSDNGRLFALDGGVYPPPPYWNGRFSNGPVAVEVLASGLGLSGARFQDLAIGGAQTGTAGQFPGSGMLNQLAGFHLALGGGQADGNALYVVWGGANDLRAGVTIGAAVGNLSTIVNGLHTLGARKFLLPNLPDLGLTPEAIQAGSSAQATFASVAFNQQLSAAYGALAAQWSDETFYYLDAMGAQRAVTAGAPGNGFTNVLTGCVTTAGCVAANGVGALYWDQIHPTAAVHQILGTQMLAAVPEPQTMLMMTAGLLLLAGLSRRRQG